MAERYQIPKLSAEAVKAERRAAIEAVTRGTGDACVT